MRVLLDTCVISEIAKPVPSARAIARVDAFKPLNIFLGAITIGEMARGVSLLPTGKKKDGVASAPLVIEEDYGARILASDAETAPIWGELDAAGRKDGRTPPTTDGSIAATAIRHGLHVVTRNVKGFVNTGAMVIDPWEEA